MTHNYTAATLVVLLCALLCASCGSETVDVGSEANANAANNTDVNNTGVNNSTPNNSAPNNTGVNNTGVNNAAPNNAAPNNAAPNNAAPNNSDNSSVDTGVDEEALCPGENAVFADADGDGFGAVDDFQCVAVDAPPPAGFADAGGDCDETDTQINPGAEDFACGDNFDENCLEGDNSCPTTDTAGLNIPDWDCVDPSAAPPNVIAWARFADGGGYFEDNGCFTIFEGLPGEFYSTRVNLERASTDPDCDGPNGCTCPSLNDWPSYDRRLYAFLLEGEADACETIALRDHAGESQVVSNHCRKYFFQLHWVGRDIEYSYIASSEAEVRDKLSRHSTVEIACAEDAPHRNLPYATLLTTEVVFNEGFVKQ